MPNLDKNKTVKSKRQNADGQTESAYGLNQTNTANMKQSTDSKLGKVWNTVITEEDQSLNSEKHSVESNLSGQINPRIDIIVDLEAPHARHNLNRLLFRLYSESPFIRVFVNKWQEWDEFSHQDNQGAPRAVYYQGCFSVYLDRKKIYTYNRAQEAAR